jgi:[acyl-carrier-protein] S-malonyltransferase
MRRAAEHFNPVLSQVRLYDAAVPVIANISAKAITSAEDIRRELSDQITSSVRWSQSIRAMAEAGVHTVVEVGPGEVLSGLSRRISRDLQAISVNSNEALGQFAGRLKEIQGQPRVTPTV